MNKLEINGFKSIKSLALDLKMINIFIGANGSGKSNLLSFIDMLKNIYNQNLHEYVALKGGVDKFLHKGDKVTSEIKCKLSFPNTNAYSFTLKKGENTFIFTKEEMWYSKDPYADNSINIASMSYESRIRTTATPRADYIRSYLAGLEKYHFHDTGENSPFNKVSNIENDIYRLYEKGNNLAAFLYNIRENDRIVYQLIVKTIQSISPYFLDFVLIPDVNANISIKWQSRNDSIVYGVNHLSDGTIRFIALATLFLQPSLPQTIIIDEPELGLHPSAIAKLAGMIKSVAGKGCQVIIATQSTDLISHFDAEDILTVDQINGESHYQRLSSDNLKSWIDDYTIDDLWKRNIITTGQPNF